jgi:hypothetical protein
MAKNPKKKPSSLDKIVLKTREERFVVCFIINIFVGFWGQSIENTIHYACGDRKIEFLFLQCII